MKRDWDPHKLEEHFTLSTQESEAVGFYKTDASRLGFSLLLTVFDYHSRSRSAHSCQYGSRTCCRPARTWASRI